MSKYSEFEILIGRNAPDSYKNSTTLKLPFTYWDYRDMLDKTQIRDDDYKLEVVDTRKHKELVERMDGKVDLFELNYLAGQLAQMDATNTILYYKMVYREPNAVLPLSHLINLTHSIDNTPLVPGIKSDTALGQFLYDTRKLGEKHQEMEQAKKLFGNHTDDFFDLLGKKHREEQNGFYTEKGYFEMKPTQLNAHYIPGKTDLRPVQEKPVVLNVSLGFFNDPDYDNDRKFRLSCPASDDEISRALDYVGAADWDECGIACVDSAVPQLKDIIEDMEPEDFDKLNELAIKLEDFERRGSLPAYKALLEAAECNDLRLACNLAMNMDAHSLRPSMNDYHDYAVAELGSIDGLDMELMEKYLNTHAYGCELAKRNGVIMTDYGFIMRDDGQPIQTQQEQPNGPSMEMQ